jgi:hypothetical protein
MVFGGGETWAEWANPWYASSTNDDDNWGKWLTASSPRQLVVTIDLIASAQRADPNWRQEGAAGRFDAYARLLARRMVGGGLSHAIIRLGNEANGPWAGDGIGTTSQQWHDWAASWRNIALAMRSVPGAHFTFVWCVAPTFSGAPFSAYYPGDDVVTYVAFDVYDGGFRPTAAGRWSYLYDRPRGIGEVLAFARRHHKPVAIPEWGPVSQADGGAGDDPAFVRHIATLAHKPGLAFQGLFDAGSSATALTPRSHTVRAYREALEAGNL